MVRDVARPFRCGQCGSRLDQEEVCAQHVAVRRVAWSFELAWAYRYVEIAARRGHDLDRWVEDVDLQEDAVGVTRKALRLALELARRWRLDGYTEGRPPEPVQMRAF